MAIGKAKVQLRSLSYTEAFCNSGWVIRGFSQPITSQSQ